MAHLMRHRKKQLFSEVGLSTLSFNADQWQQLGLFYQKPSFAIGTARAIFKCKVTYNGNVPSYTFSLVDMDTNAVLRAWRVNMLKYVAKPEPEQKKIQEKKTDTNSDTPDTAKK